MSERAMLTRAGIEHNKAAKLDPDSVDDPFIRAGIAMVAHGDAPAEAWLRVALSLAAQNRIWTKRAMEQAALMPPAPILLCPECPQRERIERECIESLKQPHARNSSEKP